MHCALCKAPNTVHIHSTIHIAEHRTISTKDSENKNFDWRHTFEVVRSEHIESPMQVCAWWLRLFWTLWNCMIWISLRTKGTNIGLDFRYNIACFCLSCISSVDLQKANALMCVYRCWLHLDTHTHTQIHTPSYHIHTCMHIKRKAFCWTSMQMEPVEVNLISPSCAKWQTHPLPYKLQGATTVENSSFWNTIYIYIYVRCPC